MRSSEVASVGVMLAEVRTARISTAPVPTAVETDRLAREVAAEAVREAVLVAAWSVSVPPARFAKSASWPVPASRRNTLGMASIPLAAVRAELVVTRREPAPKVPKLAVLEVRRVSVPRLFRVSAVAVSVDVETEPVSWM